ncbi:MAG: hypothetical protein FJ278_12675, partial [Planctomycetes bacterium]|nr:hypothetical protein [Planctomycetota bacterium]
MMMRKSSLLLIALLCCALAQGEPLDWRAQVEADWLCQAKVRKLGAQKPVITQEDAAGACDGVKDGKWGFHTENDAKPWWHVDLGKSHPLSRVVVFNRADGGSAARAGKLTLLLSNDGKDWREVYRHDGTVFYGATDSKPLAVALKGVEARFVRAQLPHAGYLHLDEVEVYGTADEKKNLALGQPANQSSVSQWSTKKTKDTAPLVYPVEEIIQSGRRLAADLRSMGVKVEAAGRELEEVAERAKAVGPEAAPELRQPLYLKARWAVRRLAWSNPLLDFDRVLFVKRVPSSFSHMSDQHYGWWSRPGGGIYVLDGLRSDSPRLRCLTEHFPEGSFICPELSYDARKVLFAYCKYYPHVSSVRNKVDKANLPEDAFYHIFEMNADGTGLRQLTRGCYDDFDARYLPNGEIVFMSTRRGQFVQCGKLSAMATLGAALPDSYVRCGGGASRPVAVYTLHVMDAAGGNLRAISPFENFEWTPSVAADGRVLFARWDYVDRSNMPFMSLWATNPDGTNLQAVYGNFTRNPHCIFEARSIPDSHKLIFTASAHHAITGGSLCLLDTRRGFDGLEPLTRLTPEVCFPESEGWPSSFYAHPYPLS